MSDKGPSPIAIVGRLTLILLTSVSLLTGYSNLLNRFAGASEDPATVLSKVLENASEFKPVMDDKGAVLYYEAYDDKGTLVGYGFIKTDRGMWGDIRIAGGIDLNYKVTGLQVIEQSETPGLGARIAERKFLDQFKEMQPEEIKLRRFGGSVDAITGASISSRAVTEIVRKEVERLRDQREEGK